MEPQMVEPKDITRWLKQAYDLMNRRILAYLLSVSLFFICLFFCSQALVSASIMAAPILLLVVFLIFTAFLFYFTLAELVMVSFSSDHSHSINPSAIIHTFLPNQKVFFKMTVFGVVIGISYWFASVLLNPGKDVYTISEQIITLLTKDSTLIFYLLKMGAVFLCFILLVMFTLRTFFCVPLILFHDMNYSEAQTLSHRAIMKNMRVMSIVLMMWVTVFIIAINVVPALAIVFLPLFSAFNYVSYRHIFLGQGTNENVKERKEAVALS